ncbi:response regulator [bacterium]|nr:response regulator [bacterium]
MSAREEVVILDDDESIRSLLSNVVENEGYVPKAFADAREALKRLEELCPIAILADIRIPGMTGLEFVHEVRKSHTNLPVIVMTGFPDQEMFRESLRYKVSDFIAKPFTIETVQKSLRHAIGTDDSFADAFLDTVTHRLREARIALGLKQSEVAARCGMSTSQVSQIELRQSAPSVTTLLKLCRTLHLTMESLVEGF